MIPTFKCLYRIAPFWTILLAFGVDAAWSQPPATLRGTLEVIQEDDFQRGQSNIRHLLIDDETGKPYWLDLPNAKNLDLKTGDRIQVRGRFNNDRFAVGGGEGDSTTTTDTSDIALLEAGAMPVPGRKVAVIIVDFVDATVSCTPEAISDLLFPNFSADGTNASVSGLYEEASNGLVGFEPDTNGDGFTDVFGPYLINATSTEPCDYFGWATEAEQLAAADGVDFSLYQHRLFVIPAKTSCSYWGWANIGCATTCRAWVARCQYLDIFAHELGHNLGLQHAATDTNNDGTIENEYGDYSCVMGYSGVGMRHPNAPYKEKMGWFADYPGQINEVVQNGTYVLSPLHLHPSSAAYPQILKIYKASTNSYYYLSYRLRSSYDAQLRTAYSDRLSIHHFSATGSGRASFVKALLDSEVFSDTVNGISVRQVSHNSDATNGYVEISVSFGCVSQAPVLSAITAQQVTNVKGTALSYPLVVRNADAAGCPPATFSMEAVVPAGWTATFSPATLMLAPGAVGDCTLTVVSPATAADGNYSITVKVVEAAHPTVSSTVSYRVDATAPTPPSNLSAKFDRKGNIVLAWTGSTDAGVGGVQYQVYRDTGSGFALYATSGSASYTDINKTVSADTTFQYYVVAQDAIKNTSGQSNTASILVKASSTTTQKTGGGKR